MDEQLYVLAEQLYVLQRPKKFAINLLRNRHTIHLRAAEEKQNGFCWYIVTNKVTLWAVSYSACVVYTKTIIHLSVGESGGYLPRRCAAR